MNVDFISFTKYRGGAAKATERVYFGLKSLNKCRLNWYAVEDNEHSKGRFWSSVEHHVVWYILTILLKLLIRNSYKKYSLNLFGDRYLRKIIRNSKLLHLHWINNEAVAIKDFPLLSNKSVVTLHDEWFYLGAEHYTWTDNEYKNAIDGYKGRTTQHFINKLMYNFKKKNYNRIKNVIFTVPSFWLKSRALNSPLLCNHDVRVVGNPVDTDVFCSRISNFREECQIQKSDFVILFGAVNGASAMVKGFDLLQECLEIFAGLIDVESINNIKVVVFGGSQKKKTKFCGFDMIEIGKVCSEVQLSKIYSSANVTIVPSRIESFGQVAAESLACCTPVLAFQTSGLKELVQHMSTGYLANCFEPEDLAKGLLYLYELGDMEMSNMGSRGRKYISDNFSPLDIASKYMAIYEELSSKCR